MCCGQREVLIIKAQSSFEVISSNKKVRAEARTFLLLDDFYFISR